MSISWSDVLARFPGDPALAAFDEDAGEAWAADAALLSASFFGARYELAQILWAAHHALATGGPGGSGGGGPAGPVTMRSEGGVTESYAAPNAGSFSADEAWWSLTRYGRMFAALLRSSPRRIMKMESAC